MVTLPGAGYVARTLRMQADATDGAAAVVAVGPASSGSQKRNHASGGAQTVG